LNPEPLKVNKRLKDSDSSLVPNKNSSEIFPSGGLGPGNLSKKWPKTYPTYNVTKNLKQTTKVFFQCRLEDLLSPLQVWTAL